jgi:phosphoserine phosphatase
MSQEIVVVQLVGQDRPGILAHVMESLAPSPVRILDMCQSVIHDTLSLGFILEIPAGEGASPLLKELLFCAHGLGLQATFRPLSQDQYEDWVACQGRPRHIVTLLGRSLTSQHLAGLGSVLAEYGVSVDAVTRLSGRVSLRQPQSTPRACLEFSVRGTPTDRLAMRAALLDLSRQMGVDIAFQEDTIFRRIRRLVCCDMDSTLIQEEVIDALAARAGVGPQVAAITEAAMRGELDFAASLTQRVGLLAGLPETVLADVAASLHLTEGAERLVRVLKALGYKVAILSGGFTYFGQHLQRQLGIDAVHANTLEIVDGRLTGRILGPIVDGPGKAQRLQSLAQAQGISLEQVIAIGDGANDLPMLQIAGLGIAFHAKPVVRAGASQAISNLGLDSVLYLLGLRDREVAALDGGPSLPGEG